MSFSRFGIAGGQVARDELESAVVWQGKYQEGICLLPCILLDYSICFLNLGKSDPGVDPSGVDAGREVKVHGGVVRAVIVVQFPDDGPCVGEVISISLYRSIVYPERSLVR